MEAVGADQGGDAVGEQAGEQGQAPCRGGPAAGAQERGDSGGDPDGARGEHGGGEGGQEQQRCCGVACQPGSAALGWACGHGSGPEGGVGVVEAGFGGGEQQGDGEPDALPGLDQVAAAAGVGVAGMPGRRGGPGGDQLAFGVGEGGDPGEAVEVLGGHAAQDQDRVAGGHAPGFGPIGGGGQRVEVIQAVGDLDRHDPAVAAQAGDPVGVLDQTRRRPQGPPQLVLDLDGVAAVACGVGEGGRPRPRAEHRGGDDVVGVVVQRGQVQRHGGGGGVGGDGGGPVEQPAQAPVTQQPEGVHQPPHRAGVVAFGVGGDDLRERVGADGEGVEEVGDGRFDPGGGGLVQRGGEQPPPGRRQRTSAGDGQQGLEQGEGAGAQVLADLVALGADGGGQGGGGEAGVEGVEGVRVRGPAATPCRPAR